MKLEVNITKTRFFVMLGAILILAASIVVYAQAGGPFGDESAGETGPSFFGHTTEQIDWSNIISDNVQAERVIIRGSTDWALYTRLEAGRLGSAKLSNRPAANPGGAPGWKLIGAANISGASTPDLVWSSSTGLVAYWYTDVGFRYSSAGDVEANPFTASTWETRAVANIDNDASSDIIFQNKLSSTGTLAYWYMNGENKMASYTLTGSLINSKAYNKGWRIMAVTDMNDDSYPDLVWQNISSKRVDITFMRNDTILGETTIPTSELVGAGWYVRGVAHLDNNNVKDLIWINEVGGGKSAIWYLNKAGSGDETTFTKASTASLTNPSPATVWLTKGTADFNGDGVEDILFQYVNNNSAPAVWYMSGNKIEEGSLASDSLYLVPVINDSEGEAKFLNFSQAVTIKRNAGGSDICIKKFNAATKVYEDKCLGSLF